MRTGSPGPLGSLLKSRSQKGSGQRRFEWRIGPREFVFFFAILYILVIGGLSLYKHEIYLSSRFDLGNMDQAVWNSSEGRILEATDEEGNLTSRLKNHADFLLLAFVPLYWIHPSPIWLLVAQAAVVGLGAVPLFWLARRFLKREWPAALIASAYLFNPGLQSANLFDFHAQTMAPTLLLFAFHYLLEKRLWPFLIFGVLASMAKEEIVLIVAMMGLYAAVVERRWRWGIPVFVAGTAYFLLIMQVVIPLFNQGDSSQLVEGRYEAFGGSITGVARVALMDPVFLLKHALSEGRSVYLFYLTGMSGFIGLFAPHVLAVPLPELAVNLLSSRPQMTSIRYQYSASILPFTYVAAAAGAANLVWLLRRLKKRSARWHRGPLRWLKSMVPGTRLHERLPFILGLAIFVFGMQMDYNAGPLPVFRAPGNHLGVIDPAPRDHLAALDEAVKLIPPDTRVSASNHIGAHLAHRRYLYLFPTVLDAEYVIVDETKPGYDVYLSPVLNLRSVQKLRRDPAYEEIYARSGVVVFKRTGEPDSG